MDNYLSQAWAVHPKEYSEGPFELSTARSARKVGVLK
jgi:hypothetical protein